MISILAAAVITGATLASTPARVVDVAQVYEDVRVIRRVASVTTEDMPRETLSQLVDENVDRLRGKVDERNFAYATWTRVESARDEESATIKKSKKDRTTIVDHEGPSAYRAVISSPNHRYVAARNRPIDLLAMNVEYTTDDGVRRAERFELASVINPGEEKIVDFTAIGWDVKVSLEAVVSAGAIGNGTISIALSRPTLSDNSDSPFSKPTVTLLSMKGPIRARDVLEIRRLCDATTAHFDETVGEEARARVEPVGGAPKNTSPLQPAILHGELQQIEDLLKGDANEHAAGLDKLHQLIISVRPARSWD